MKLSFQMKEIDRKRNGDPGQGMGEDRGQGVPGPQLSPAHKSPESTFETVPTMSVFKRAKKSSPVRMTFRSMKLGQDTVSVLTTEYERGNNGGPERALVFGPMKWTNPRHMEQWFVCATRSLNSPQTIPTVLKNVKEVAGKHAWRSS